MMMRLGDWEEGCGRMGVATGDVGVDGRGVERGIAGKSHGWPAAGDVRRV
jgi:hypothetical protein